MAPVRRGRWSGVGDGRAVMMVGVDAVAGSSSSSSSAKVVGMIEQAVEKKILPKPYAMIISEWYATYEVAVVESGMSEQDAHEFSTRMFSTLLERVMTQVRDPFQFECYHSSVREPFDYYNFGIEFARPIVNLDDSTLRGVEILQKLAEQLAHGENVVFLANHQSEGDPHAVDILISKLAGLSELAEDLVFMAGDRVREDALVVPFSLGRNLLTVYSKKHINDEPERREEKQLHNRRTIKATENLFKAGGKCIWFAPSGGRDRRSSESGKVEIAPFDADAVEMMRFTALKSSTPTHFYGMALATYALLPPPETVDKALGERRIVKHTPLAMAVTPEIEWDTLVPQTQLGAIRSEASAIEDPKSKRVFLKNAERKARADRVTALVSEEYEAINGFEQ